MRARSGRLAPVERFVENASTLSRRASSLGGVTDVAAHHAELAARLLAGIAALDERLENLTDEDRLELAVSGGLARANADLRWTAELAIAHALTSIALALASGERLDHPTLFET